MVAKTLQPTDATARMRKGPMWWPSAPIDSVPIAQATIPSIASPPSPSTARRLIADGVHPNCAQLHENAADDRERKERKLVEEIRPHDVERPARYLEEGDADADRDTQKDGRCRHL